MGMRNIILWISVLVLMSGCRTSLQSNWKNFNAYYNTFYNAEKSYEAGLKKNLAQTREYNPLQPIRIHPAPVNAGAQDFDKAIQKAADILRRHDDTKWVDDAIYLIGKSYYYRQDYFSADQKFRELYITTDDPEMQFRSSIWQGRVFLDMELHSEGVAFLNEKLNDYEGIWSRSDRAEALALLAQHNAGLENWQPAVLQLTKALPDLNNKGYRERGYFLLGQLYERINEQEAAYRAYEEVQEHFSEYRVQYLAQRKRAEVARKLGRNDLAFSIFDDMIRDDKNVEYRSELDFELARTEHERQNYRQAEDLYNNVLHNRNSQPPAEIKARAYYGLAEIHRFGYDDFSRAAAYYDSAAQVNVTAERLPDDFEAESLAESFGNYARIKSEISLQDSLLSLGRLSQAELDSALAEIRLQKIQELEEQREEQQQQRDQIVTVDGGDDDKTTQNTTNGFLNENSPVLQQNIRQQFYATWGNRPLADNWRVRSMIRASTYSDEIEEDQLMAEDSELFNIEIDLSRVPFTEEAQDSVRKRIAAYDYELGNLFFLSMNMPDSAVHYFEKAIERPSNDNINMVSLYSLSELYSIEGNEQKAQEYASRLINDYPQTAYAQRLAEQYGIGLEDTQETWSEVDPIQIYSLILDQDSLGSADKADRLRSFSVNFSSHEVAPKAQFEAIQLYMNLAKEDSSYQNKLNRWIQLNEEHEAASEKFETMQDSAETMLEDTTLTEDQRSEYQSLVDSTFQKQDISDAFPYEGMYWDSARTVIDTFLEMFPDSELQPRVARLHRELQLTETEQEQGANENEGKPTPEPSNDGYLSCDDIGEELAVRGGMEQFINGVNISGDFDINELRYHFKVNQRGIVEEYRLLTEEVPEALEDTFAQQIEEALSFESVLYEGQAISLACDVVFPINGSN